MKKVIIIVVLYLSTVLTCFSQYISNDQQQKLQDYFGTNSKLATVSQPIIEELIGEQPGFFGKYSDALTTIDILGKVANAEDAQALEVIILYFEGKLVEKLMPGLNSVLGWVGWVKTGMELFVDFVINPELMSAANETYYNNRTIGMLEPDLAVANIRAWGNIEQQIMAQFRTKYGDYCFNEIKPSGLVLLPKWKSRFDRFVLASFENQFQIRRIKEFQNEAIIKLQKQNEDFEVKTNYLYHLIEKKLEELDVLTISPSSETINIGESVSFVVNAINKGGDKSDVTSDALSESIFTATKQGVFTITATLQNISVSSTITVNGSDNCKENEIWDTTIKDCICMPGYERNENGECVVIDTSSNINILPPIEITLAEINNQLNNSDCAKDPHGIAEWDAVNKKVICSCEDFYTWDETAKKCVANVQEILANSDCSPWPNTEPKWDYGSNEPYCDCVSGYQWNDDYTECLSEQDLAIAQADCSQYPNSQAILDPVSKEVICDCLPGYEWNEDYTKCISKALAEMQDFDCSMFPNTEAKWDPVNKEAYCDCLPGYEWAANNSGCIEIQTVQQPATPCAHLANSRAFFDPALNETVCDCLPGFMWNRDQSACIPIPKKPKVDWDNILTMTLGVMNAVNPNNQGLIPTSSAGSMTGMPQQATHKQSNCNDQQQAGANVPEVHTIDLGQSFGSFIFEYETFNEEDQIIITNGGVTIFNSGCVGENKRIQLNLRGISPTITVRVNPNCDGGTNTAWNFTVHCPDN